MPISSLFSPTPHRPISWHWPPPGRRSTRWYSKVAVTSASKTQARRVFYAGAQAILDILLGGLDPEKKVTEGDVDRMAALSAELRAFGENVEAGRA